MLVGQVPPKQGFLTSGHTSYIAHAWARCAGMPPHSFFDGLKTMRSSLSKLGILPASLTSSVRRLGKVLSGCSGHYLVSPVVMSANGAMMGIHNCTYKLQPLCAFKQVQHTSLLLIGNGTDWLMVWVHASDAVTYIAIHAQLRLV